MSKDTGVLAYTIQETVDAPIYLCIQDQEKGEFHRFELSALACSRLAFECAGYVNRHIGGYCKKMK